MSCRAIITSIVLGACLLLVGSVARGDKSPDLQRGFQHPPDSARPWVYWFWLNGNITREGITADLEAMKRVGIGGVLIMEVDQGAPPGPAPFASGPWRKLFKHVCAEADRLGLQVNMNNDAGWCGSGGPWITPDLAMQKIVWTETAVHGPSRFEAPVPQPQAVADYYRDVAVLAFPTPPAERVRVADLSPKVTTSAGGNDVDASKLLDGDARTSVALPRPSRGKPQFIQFEFPRPFTARSISVSAPVARNGWAGSLQVSDDGRKFKTVRDLEAAHSAVTLPETAARFFRVAFTRLDSKLQQLLVTDIDLGAGYRIEDIQAKAAFTPQQVPLQGTWPGISADLSVPRGRVIDITPMLKDGRLAWDVPEGDWTILRLGHTPTGKDNHPAPEAGRGLESDKLSKHATEVHFNALMGKLVDDVGPLAGKTLVATHIDSWETGSQNWTPLLRQEFQRRRGYDLLPYMPAMTGRVIDSLEMSERFLWDLRQTISELVLENYAGHMRDLAHQRGLRLSIEAYDNCPTDQLTYAGRADEPMGEFWSWAAYGTAYSCTEMTSAAHVYGKRIIGAEAFTATSAEKWLGHPANVKAIGDWAFCEGINRFVFHRYALQPWLDRAPGMSMGPWGLHYERTQTWWEQTKAWHEYLARCQYLLRQGLFVADVCYLAPENSPQRFTPLPAENHDRPPYNYDACPPEVVMTRMSVKDGRLVLPDGMSYRVLVLPPAPTMTPSLLRKVKELVEAGATVLGSPPLKSPGLSAYPTCDTEVARLTGEIWGDAKATSPAEHRVGKGRVVSGKSPEEFLASTGVAPDFTSSNRLRYIHRTAGEAELYFVSNPHPVEVEDACTFRVAGKQPEIWRPDTDRIEPAAVFSEKDGRTTLHLRLEPSGSVFVVFRNAARGFDPIVAATHDGRPILVPSAASPRITIRSATYGVPGDPARTRDVRKKLQAMVDSGEYTFRVSRLAQGDDPAYMVVKTLTVDYTNGEAPLTIAAQDPQTISLFSPVAPPRTADVRRGEDGRLLLEAWQPGRYELTTAGGAVRRFDVKAVPPTVDVGEPWDLRFPAGRGAPDHVTLQTLVPWNRHEIQGVKYFSGTATYHKTLGLSADQLAPGRRLYLDLGRVEVIAEVSINGKQLGTLWKPPFALDVTGALKPGENDLEINVTNLWPNRMIGDEQLPEDGDRNPNGTLKEWPKWLGDGRPSPTGRYTFTSWRLWSKDSPLLDSGLIGPVTLRATICSQY